MTPEHPIEPTQFALSVLVRVRAIPDNPWQSESWDVDGIIVHDTGSRATQDRQVLRESENERILLYNGFTVALYRDDAESYYHNLVAEHPSAFVQCSREESGELRPQLVTLSYAEGTSYMEVEYEVFAVPMPPELYKWLERFVLQHYIPEKKKKRKREDWKQQDGVSSPREKSLV